MPHLEKSELDLAEIKNYRPISNLPFMSKVIEKLILAQLTCYLTANSLFLKFQSGFRRYHTTETAVFKVLSDIYSAIDQDQVSLLTLLDVNAAFDTVDHGILLERLSTSYGLSGLAFTWLESYITSLAQIQMLATTIHLHLRISEGTFGSQRFLYLLTTAMESTSSQYSTSPQRTSTLQKNTKTHYMQQSVLRH